MVLVSLSLTLGLMSHTYSRYIADATSDIKIQFSKWEIKINNNDITNGSISTMKLTPVMEGNNHVASNVVAPSSKGYFDIVVDPSNVEVSFNYSVSLNIINGNIPDLIISKYSIIDSSYTEGDEIQTISLVDGKINGTVNYNQNKTFEPFTIRVFFEWYEGENEKMNDEADTQIGIDASNNNTELQIQAISEAVNRKVPKDEKSKQNRH